MDAVILFLGQSIQVIIQYLTYIFLFGIECIPIFFPFSEGRILLLIPIFKDFHLVILFFLWMLAKSSYMPYYDKIIL